MTDFRFMWRVAILIACLGLGAAAPYALHHALLWGAEPATQAEVDLDVQFVKVSGAKGFDFVAFERKVAERAKTLGFSRQDVLCLAYRVEIAACPEHGTGQEAVGYQLAVQGPWGKVRELRAQALADLRKATAASETHSSCVFGPPGRDRARAEWKPRREGAAGNTVWDCETADDRHP